MFDEQLGFLNAKNRFGEVFTLPTAILPPVAARVMDLQEPTRKMSKSASSEKGVVFVLDEPDAVAAKFRSAVTDSDGEVRVDRAAKPGVTNLLEILAATTSRTVEQAADEHAASGYGALKTAVAEAVIAFLAPIRARSLGLAADHWRKAVGQRRHALTIRRPALGARPRTSVHGQRAAGQVAVTAACQVVDGLRPSAAVRLAKPGCR